ncbi:MAG: metal dependent phosphohydrolase, partial [Bacteroidetes bacterium]|nr:metal dependent phosphohydrolase [Bacteroidota bacterium]
MSENSILNKIENHIRELYQKRSAVENIYHNILHTTEVVKVAAKIAEAEKLSKDETEILLIAAWFHDTGYFHCWFHDTGYFHCCKGHEEQSSEYARDFLERENYPDEKILKIISCIKATQIPHSPNTKLEEIICDADLHHLGMNDIEERGEMLRKELEMKGIKKLSDIEWLKASLDFF